MHLLPLRKRYVPHILYMCWAVYPALHLIINHLINSNCYRNGYLIWIIIFSVVITLKLYLWLLAWSFTRQCDNLPDSKKKGLTWIIYSSSLVLVTFEVFLFLSLRRMEEIHVIESDESDMICGNPSIQFFFQIFPLWSGTHIIGGILLWVFNLRAFVKYGFDAILTANHRKPIIFTAIVTIYAFCILVSLSEVAGSGRPFDLCTFGLYWATMLGIFLNFAYELADKASLSQTTLHHHQYEIANSFGRLTFVAVFTVLLQYLDFSKETFLQSSITLFFSMLIGISLAFTCLYISVNSCYQYRQESNAIQLSAEDFEELVEKLAPDNQTRSEGECVICWEEYKLTDKTITLQTCKHAYHYDCLLTWVRGRHKTCPECRAIITV